MVDRECSDCAERNRSTSLRDDSVAPIGLVAVGDEVFGCSACGQRYDRTIEPASMFHDYDEYFFTKREEVASSRTECPQCGSADAGPDESRSAYEFTYMSCRACGHGDLVDPWERDEWLTRSVARCARCIGPDPSEAWKAQHARRLAALVQESHFSIQVSACLCGQRFVTVFTERVDWQGGEDEQTWLVLPVSAREAAELGACVVDELVGALVARSAGRRFLLRSFPTGALVSASWQDAGFSIGPHD